MNAKQKKQIADIMEKHGVLVGYLFGSAQKGTMGPHSDIDTAVFFDEKKVPKEKQFDAKMEISGEIARAFPVPDSDVINLNQVQNPVLRYDAVVQGEVIYDKEPKVRAHLARAVLREYEDTKYMRETSYRILHEQIKSGQFGRASINHKKYVSS